jgi:hypothetical protein
MTSIKLRKANPLVKRLLALTFPDYTGRKVELRTWTGPRVLDNYWDGGSRSWWRLVSVAAGTVAEPTNDNPFMADAHEKADLPAAT